MFLFVIEASQFNVSFYILNSLLQVKLACTTCTVLILKGQFYWPKVYASFGRLSLII